jgi:hypothetical protein
MTQRYDGNERRQHLRLEGDMVNVKFRRVEPLPFGEPDFDHDGHLLDISKGGMCFQSDHAITRGEKIHYRVNGAEGETPREGIGKVVRASRDRDFFYIAVEFIT